MSELNNMRKQIDKCDAKILELLNKRTNIVLLELLNKRTNIVLKIKKTKEAKKLNRHSPERERQILEKIKKINKGPFPDNALKAIYKEILSASSH
jgi:chorismate mutase